MTKATEWYCSLCIKYGQHSSMVYLCDIGFYWYQWMYFNLKYVFNNNIKQLRLEISVDSTCNRLNTQESWKCSWNASIILPSNMLFHKLHTSSASINPYKWMWILPVLGSKPPVGYVHVYTSSAPLLDGSANVHAYMNHWIGYGCDNALCISSTRGGGGGCTGLTNIWPWNLVNNGNLI